MSSFFAPTAIARDKLIAVILFAHLCLILPYSILSNHIHALWPAIIAYCAALVSMRMAGGTFISRAVLAVSLMIFSAVLIHLSDGLIEIHFHIFFSLVLLSLYYDWRVIVIAALAVVIHHLVGLVTPIYQVYEVNSNINIYLLHILFVAITCVVLCYQCEIGRRSVGTITHQNQQLVDTVEILNQARSLGNGVSDDLVAVVAGLNDATGQQNANTQQQAAALLQINAVLRELTQTAQNITMRAQVIDGAAKRVLTVTEQGQTATNAAAETGRDGQQAVAQTLNATTAVVDVYTALVAALSGLLERSLNLKTVAQMLREISMQTHLLSLNAAIEAASAGASAGQNRFHAVAGQVRALAQDSIRISSQADGIIRDIETRIVQAVLVVESGQRHAVAAVATAHQSGTVHGKLVEMVQQSARDVAAIAAEAQIMVSLTTEIGSATAQQAQAATGAAVMVQTTTDHAQQTLAASHMISQTTLVLNRLATTLAQTLAH